jgi:hypothetical protein
MEIGNRPVIKTTELAINYLLLTIKYLLLTIKKHEGRRTACAERQVGNIHSRGCVFACTVVT